MKRSENPRLLCRETERRMYEMGVASSEYLGPVLYLYGTSIMKLYFSEKLIDA